MIKIKAEVYNNIINTIGKSPIESGGIIGMKNGVICSYYFDGYTNSKSEYIPNVNALNKVISDWFNDKIEFVGIVHSHPNQLNILSLNDINYAKELLSVNSYLKEIYFPIVTIKYDKIFLTFYSVSDDVKRLDYDII
jgi:proteasome lid subunit RPN8/RPN11